jgi:hypothetical protein
MKDGVLVLIYKTKTPSLRDQDANLQDRDQDQDSGLQTETKTLKSESRHQDSSLENYISEQHNQNMNTPLMDATILQYLHVTWWISKLRRKYFLILFINKSHVTVSQKISLELFTKKYGMCCVEFCTTFCHKIGVIVTHDVTNSLRFKCSFCTVSTHQSHEVLSIIPYLWSAKPVPHSLAMLIIDYLTTECLTIHLRQGETDVGNGSAQGPVCLGIKQCDSSWNCLH